VTKNGKRELILKKIDKIINNLEDLTRGEIKKELITLKKMVWNSKGDVEY